MRNSLLSRCLAGEAVDRPPVWLMRQAGRWDPEFNKLRAGLSFFEFSARPDLAAAASLLPRRYGVDAIILFYDITTLPVAMGLPFTLQPGMGPVPDQPIRSEADVARLQARPAAERFEHILELQRRVQAELNGELPVLVFAGAPFTVASYCIGTGKRIGETLRFATDQPRAWHLLLQKLEAATIHFLECLMGQGALAFQLFDSWAGELGAAQYGEWAAGYHRRILSALAAFPSILFVKESPYLELDLQAPATVLSLGASHDLARLRRDHPQHYFQGNVDSGLMVRGTPEQVANATHHCIAAGAGQRHIVNLNHGLDRDTPPANVIALVEAVHQSRRGEG